MSLQKRARYEQKNKSSIKDDDETIDQKRARISVAACAETKRKADKIDAQVSAKIKKRKGGHRCRSSTHDMLDAMILPEIKCGHAFPGVVLP